MTETELKLSDAKIQLSLALDHKDDEGIVRSCVNSFISLACSVTFVMQAESGGDSTPLSQWYRVQINSMDESHRRLLKFFNDKRVYTIHRGTVTLRPTRGAVFAEQFAKNGNVIFREQFTSVWLFNGTEEYGLSGSTSALWLCRSYLDLLERLVAGWVQERDDVDLP